MTEFFFDRNPGAFSNVIDNPKSQIMPRTLVLSPRIPQAHNEFHRSIPESRNQADVQDSSPPSFVSSSAAGTGAASSASGVGVGASSTVGGTTATKARFDS